MRGRGREVERGAAPRANRGMTRTKQYRDDHCRQRRSYSNPGFHDYCDEHERFPDWLFHHRPIARFHTRDCSRHGDLLQRSITHNQRSFSAVSRRAVRPAESSFTRPVVEEEGQVVRQLKMEDRRRTEGLRRLGVEGGKQNYLGEIKGQAGGGNSLLCCHDGNHALAGSAFRRYVSFYFTNFPAQLSNFYLRKGFEVCGILEDVYVPNRRNKRGEPFGFVKFSKVRDVSKLLVALNNVWFGHFRVRTRIASFDRNDRVEGGRTLLNTPAEMKEASDPVRTKCILNSKRHPNPVSASARPEVELMKTYKGNAGVGGVRGDPSEEMRVGDVVVKLGERKVPTEKTKRQTEEGGVFSSNPGESVAVVKATDHKLMLRSYKTMNDDVRWAQKGLVATITNGEAVPVEKTLIDVVNNAKDFFILIFSHWMRWDFCQQTYKRGAWVRLYGIPVHAWNVNFFKLCVFDCATPELEIVNTVVNVLVDGTLVKVKVVEEWGYALGEDTCLFEEERESEMSQPDVDVGHVDLDATREVNNFVEAFADGLEKEFDTGVQATHLASDAQVEIEGRSAEDVEVMPNSIDQVVVSATAPGPDLLLGSAPRNVGIGDFQSSPEAQDSASICSPVEGSRRHTGFKRQDDSLLAPKCVKRTTSCPPGGNRSIVPGPWSLDWLQDLNQGDAGVLFSAQKRPLQGVRVDERKKKVGREDASKKKVGGVFRHTLSSLKKVARLPSKDRSEVLRILKKTERRQRVRPRVPRLESVSNSVNSVSSASSVSCTNDWKHWVVMQGSEQVAAEDVVEVGKAIGVTLNVDTANRLSVLDWADNGFEKRQETRQLVGNQRPFLLCLQETKLQLCDGFIGASIWGKSPHDFSYRPSVGASGGLLTLWDSAEVEVWASESYEHVLWCHGRFLKSGDGLSMSRLDKFLLSGDWCLTWPNCTQVARMRGLSDHCPLVLCANEEDWGPCPSRMLKCWRDIPGYNTFVKDKWNSCLEHPLSKYQGLLLTARRHSYI
ncbi:hypothetical protein TSUD_414300 [Trifolium subterraneum]|uniref:RRM domain-containing protein n=1 Tax=Trifolium subterraneum TaxID=3900 RepID=A0A2Z6P721_TRISU|nr:hypothetical protein TSUD_414300 [Trifolium subterraneum]